jgi:hypothetical protein
MLSNKAGLRGALAVLGALALAAGAWRPAAAMSLDNQTRLKAYFPTLGKVTYDLYAPLGGPEVAAALLDDGGGPSSGTLHVVRVAPDGKIETLLTKPLTNAGLSHRQPFTFLLTGKHLLTYPTVLEKDASGRAHERGDLSVYDLLADGGPRLLFSLPDVEDLGYQPAGALSNDNLLRQPSAHFLNRMGVLPVKYDYFRLSYDPQIGQYRLFHHLTALPDADTVAAANKNDRALAAYYAGYMMDATRDLDQASQLAEADQTTIYHNQDYIKSELDDLAAQGHLMPDQPYDDALLAFWQGDYRLVLRILDQRHGDEQKQYTDEELAMLGISLAGLRRWPEADKVTGELAQRRFVYMGDYVYELVKVAEYEQLPQVVTIQLRNLQGVDPGNPGLVAALARVLERNGKVPQAEAMLAHYLDNNLGSGRSLLPARLQLYSIYFEGGDTSAMSRLSRDALKSHSGSLRGFVDLADYLDFRGVFTDVPLEAGEHMKAPDKPLDTLSIQ